MQHLRDRLHGEARLSVHTSGVLAIRKMDVFNRYDRACISFPSFEPATYARLMGSPRMPDLGAIVRQAAIPVKVSCVVTDANAAEIPSFLERCHGLGVRRVVLRTLFGEMRLPTVVQHLPVAGSFRGNPVLDLRGMEVTWWDFDRTEMTSINLFADGTLGTSYLLTQTPELRQHA